MFVTLAFIALLVEALVGYPDWLGQSIGHPVTWVGRLIGLLDDGLNDERLSSASRRAAGIGALLIVIGITGGAAYVVEQGLFWLPLGVVFAALPASTLLAQRSLHAHVERVATALEREGLAAGRKAVAHIVGRDTRALDEAAVARAAIESLAENFSDGVVAPALWLATGGLAGGVIYKAINTADSMIGHRTRRHEAFGWAAARLDDLVNLPASRLSALLLIAAAATTGRTAAVEAWRAVLRDASRHRSPNAGYPEAAMAGALDLALAGPRIYDGIEIADAIMGRGRRAATAADIRNALALFRRADAMLIGLGAVLAVLFTAPG
ncbi:MAG TPA: adenosylcobinamide-phosphate synthase CbiB [Xanthobacteraceae bacterium]|nr:adenosylcobinamide-phosphate synthase CbiB [Xanthobacteraceae bacterium]